MSAGALITEPRREWRKCLVCGSGPFLLSLGEVCASCEIIGLAELPDDEDDGSDYGTRGDGVWYLYDFEDPADEREERANDEAEEEEERRRKEEENDHDDERKRDDAREHI